MSRTSTTFTPRPLASIAKTFISQAPPYLPHVPSRQPLSEILRLVPALIVHASCLSPQLCLTGLSQYSTLCVSCHLFYVLLDSWLLWILWRPPVLLSLWRMAWAIEVRLYVTENNSLGWELEWLASCVFQATPEGAAKVVYWEPGLREQLGPQKDPVKKIKRMSPVLKPLAVNSFSAESTGCCCQTTSWSFLLFV